MKAPVLGVAMLLALVACSATPPAGGISSGSTTAPTVDYAIAPGDVVEITVFGQNDLSGQFTVDSEGSISMPLINQIAAAGLSTRELELRLIEKLQPDFLRNPDVSVKLLTYRPIYVLGEVQNAGSYPYQPNMSVLSAIAVAGGYTYRAAKKKIFVVRGDDSSGRQINVSENTTLRPGDTVIIGQRLF
ncbi:MAG: polysaccharide biosynthesis/export family protein [Woeseia sp.]